MLVEWVSYSVDRSNMIQEVQELFKMADITHKYQMVKEMDSGPSIRIDFGFPFYMGINTRFTSLMWIKIRFPSYTWIDFRFLLPYWNQHLIPGSWWESLIPNVHKIKELWLWNTSVMEVKYGFTVNLENNFQQMNMMMNMTIEKGCALIGRHCRTLNVNGWTWTWRWCDDVCKGCLSFPQWKWTMDSLSICESTKDSYLNMRLNLWFTPCMEINLEVSGYMRIDSGLLTRQEK